MDEVRHARGFHHDDAVFQTLRHCAEPERSISPQRVWDANEMSDGRWGALSHEGTGRPVARAPDYSALSRALPLAPPDPQEAPPSAPERGWVEHVVGPRDTIMGLALRYGVTPGEIKLANQLPTDNLATARVLRVPTGRVLPPPPPPADNPAAIIRRFRAANGVSEKEARYYLEEARYDERAAAAELAADLRVEAAEPEGLQRALAEAARPTLAPEPPAPMGAVPPVGPPSGRLGDRGRAGELDAEPLLDAGGGDSGGTFVPSSRGAAASTLRHRTAGR